MVSGHDPPPPALVSAAGLDRSEGSLSKAVEYSL